MSFECARCHRAATDREAIDVHYRVASFGACETCGEVKETFHCQCRGDWAGARMANVTKEVPTEPAEEARPRKRSPGALS
jgi:hypothetical protein